mgnify:FL=1
MVQGRPAMLSSIRRILGKSGLDACMMMLCGYSINPRSEWVQGIPATSYAFDPARYSDISEAVDEVYTRYAAQGVRKFAHLHYGLRFLQASRLVALL